MKKIYKKRKSFLVLGSFLTLLVGVWGVYASTNNVDYTYGDNSTTQQTNDSTNGYTTPGQVENVFTAGGTSYALTTNGSVYAWGNNGYGQVGDNSVGNVTTPVIIFDSTGQDASTVDADISNLVLGNTIITIYSNYLTESSYNFKLNEKLTTYAITTNGSVYAWGNNKYGQVGNGKKGDNVHKPTMIFDSTGKYRRAIDADVSQVVTNGYTSYAITTNGDVYAWGVNNVGQVGNNSTRDVKTPTMIFDSTGTDSSAVDASVSQVVTNAIGTTYAITTNGSVYAWGNNLLGQVGNGNSYANWKNNNGNTLNGYGYVLTPTMIFDSTGQDSNAIDAGVSQVITNGSGTTYAITTNGSVYAWGDNKYGQVGNGNTSNVSTPTMIFDSTGADSSAVDADVSQIVTTVTGTTYAITTDGSVYAWGANNVGQVGNNSTTNVTTPTMIFDSTGTDSSAVDADASQIVTDGTGTTYALTTNGSVYAWGNNEYGQVGNNNTRNISTPTMIFDSTGTDSSAIDADVSQIVTNAIGTTYALTKNGSVYAWGNNIVGQVGNGSPSINIGEIITSDPTLSSLTTNGIEGYTFVSTPTMIFNSQKPTSLFGGGFSQKIPNKFVSPSSMVYADVSDVVTSDGTTSALTTNGSVYTWGNNTDGQIGNGTTTNVTTPTLVLDLNITISDVDEIVNSSNNTIDVDYQLNIPTWTELTGEITVSLYNPQTGEQITSVTPQKISPSAGTTYNGEFINVPITQPNQSFEVVITYIIGGEIYEYDQTSNTINTTTNLAIDASLENNNTINYSITNIYDYTNGTYTATLINSQTGKQISGVTPQFVTPTNGLASGTFDVPINTSGDMQVQLTWTPNSSGNETTQTWTSNTISGVNTIPTITTSYDSSANEINYSIALPTTDGVNSMQVELYDTTTNKVVSTQTVNTSDFNTNSPTAVSSNSTTSNEPTVNGNTVTGSFSTTNLNSNDNYQVRVDINGQTIDDGSSNVNIMQTNSFSLLWIFILIIVLLVVVSGGIGYWYWRKKRNIKNDKDMFNKKHKERI